MRMKHMGNKILELINVSKSFGDKKLIERFTYSFRKGERIGIVGNNGTGKSTLLKMITGKLEVDMGKVVVGETIEFGNYSQEGIVLKEDKRVIEVIRDIELTLMMQSWKDAKNSTGRKSTGAECI